MPLATSFFIPVSTLSSAMLGLNPKFSHCRRILPAACNFLLHQAYCKILCEVGSCGKWRTFLSKTCFKSVIFQQSSVFFNLVLYSLKMTTPSCLPSINSMTSFFNSHWKASRKCWNHKTTLRQTFFVCLFLFDLYTQDLNHRHMTSTRLCPEEVLQTWLWTTSWPGTGSLFSGMLFSPLCFWTGQRALTKTSVSFLLFLTQHYLLVSWSLSFLMNIASVPVFYRNMAKMGQGRALWPSYLLSSSIFIPFPSPLRLVSLCKVGIYLVLIFFLFGSAVLQSYCLILLFLLPLLSQK